MKKLLIPLSLISSIVCAEEYDYKVLRVIDGDTVVVEAPYLPKPLPPEISIRVLGIDTPEKDFRAKCEDENIRGHMATEFTKNVVEHANSIKVSIVQWDKFGSRLDGDLIIDGQKLSKMLIDNGLARSYHGEKKESWCDIPK